MAPKVANVKIRIAGAANRRTCEILREPGRRGCKDMGPFGAVSSMGKPTTTTGGLRVKSILAEAGRKGKYFLLQFPEGKLLETQISCGQRAAFVVLSVRFLCRGKGEGLK